MASFRIPRIEVSSETIRNTTRLRADKSIEKAMFRAGSITKNQIIVNLRNEGMKLSEQLIKSIGFSIEGSGDEMNLIVGSFNNDYAHINEFGSNNITDRVRRAMFARLREEGHAPNRGKGVIQGNVFSQRPFIGPAIRGHNDRIMAFLRDAIREFDLIERFG
jgi:hypothetical protein